jgi:ferritin-like protein
MPQLAVIADPTDAKAKIDFIKQQGEGTSTTPFAPDGSGEIAGKHELAHFYRFGAIYEGRCLKKDPSAPRGWSYSGDPIPFPDPKDLFLMSEVHATGWSPESDDFDHTYTKILKKLHDAWAQGNANLLNDAIGCMDSELTPAAQTLLGKGYPSGSGKGIKGPDFRFLP